MLEKFIVRLVIISYQILLFWDRRYVFRKINFIQPVFIDFVDPNNILCNKFLSVTKYVTLLCL